MDKAYLNQDFPVMEHLLLKYNISPPRDISSALAYKASDKGYLDMAQHLIKNCSADLSYAPNDRSPCLQEKLIQKNTEFQIKKAIRQA